MVLSQTTRRKTKMFEFINLLSVIYLEDIYLQISAKMRIDPIVYFLLSTCMAACYIYIYIYIYIYNEVKKLKLS